MPKRRDSEHLADARDHLAVLQEHLKRGELSDALVRDAVSHRLEVAIDAVGRTSPELVESEIGEDWPRIVAMRNILAHQYAELDQDILRNTVENRLGRFIEAVERLRRAAAEAETREEKGRE